MPDRRKALLRDPKRLASSLVGVAAGVAVLAFFLSLGSGARAVIESDLFPAGRLELIPAGRSAGLAGVMPRGGQRALVREDTVSAIRSLAGVEAVYPRMKLAFPARAWGGKELLGEEMWTEVIGDGIPPEMVEGSASLFVDSSAAEIGKRCSLDSDCSPEEYCGPGLDGDRCTRPVPFLVSRRLIEIYNSTVAPAHGTPTISDWLLGRAKGLRLNLGLGESSLGRARMGQPRQVMMAFAGISHEAAEMGITVPIGYARLWNEEYAGPESVAGYSSLTVILADKEAVAPVAASARGLGLEITSRGEERIGVAVTLFQALFAALGILLLSISTMNIVHIFYLTARERRMETALMRAVGGTRVDVALDFVMGGAIVGGLGSVAGICLAVALAALANMAAARWLPAFPYKPDDFFRFTPALIVACAAMGIASSLLGSLVPAWTATREDPARALL